MKICLFLLLRTWLHLAGQVGMNLLRHGFPNWSINLTCSLLLMKPTSRALQALGWAPEPPKLGGMGAKRPIKTEAS